MSLSIISTIPIPVGGDIYLDKLQLTLCTCIGTVHYYENAHLLEYRYEHDGEDSSFCLNPYIRRKYSFNVFIERNYLKCRHAFTITNNMASQASGA